MKTDQETIPSVTNSPPLCLSSCSRICPKATHELGNMAEAVHQHTSVCVCAHAATQHSRYMHILAQLTWKSKLQAMLKIRFQVENEDGNKTFSYQAVRSMASSGTYWENQITSTGHILAKTNRSAGCQTAVNILYEWGCLSVGFSGDIYCAHKQSSRK